MFMDGSKGNLICDNCGWSKTATTQQGDVVFSGQFDWENKKIVAEACPKCKVGRLSSQPNDDEVYQAPKH